MPATDNRSASLHFRQENTLKQFATPSILALALVLTACGGGGGTADTGSAQLASVGASAEANPASADASSAASDASATMSVSSTSSSKPDTSSSPSTTPESPSTPTTPTAPVATARTVDYYGDSTVWGYVSGGGGQVATPAPAAFAQSLAGSSIKYTVRNEGVSGTTACDLLNGTDGRHPKWDQQMASSNANYVIINHAINDEWKYSLTTYKSCLRSLAQTAKAYGKTVVFETPNPTRDSGPGGLDTMVAAMKEVAGQEQVAVIDQYQYLTNYLAGRSPYTICPDGLHPTAEVYIMKGQYAARSFASLFPA
jgi:lysophospholipase L1-like esterase